MYIFKILEMKCTLLHGCDKVGCWDIFSLSGHGSCQCQQETNDPSLRDCLVAFFLRPQTPKIDLARFSLPQKTPLAFPESWTFIYYRIEHRLTFGWLVSFAIHGLGMSVPACDSDSERFACKLFDNECEYHIWQQYWTWVHLKWGWELWML